MSEPVWKTILMKLMKSELWIVVLGMLAAVLGPKLGIEKEQMTEFLLSISTMVAVYVGGRSYSKPREKTAEVAAANPT
jgi:hypothetical protein